MLDVWVAIFLLATFPIQFILIENATSALQNAWRVIAGKRTWVGYSTFQNTLPLIPAGVLLPNGLPNNSNSLVNKSLLKKTDTIYAREYDWMQDLKIIYKSFKKLGSS